MKTKLTFLLIVSVLLTVSQTHWKAGTTSSVKFKIKNLGITVDGSLAGLVTDINFDAVNYDKGSMEGSVDANSINTGNDMRNGHLKKEEYFNVAKFPKISLKSTSFTREKDGTYKGAFKLTMKGITKDVVIPFTYTESGNTAIFKGSFPINRRTFEVGGNSWTLSDELTVDLMIKATK